MRALAVVVLLLLLVGGLLLVRHQASEAAEAQHEAEREHRAALAARLEGHGPLDGKESPGGDPSLDELRDENTELKGQIEELRLLIAELEAAADGR